MEFLNELAVIQSLPLAEGIQRAEALLTQLNRNEQLDAVKTTVFFLLDGYRQNDQIDAEINLLKKILYDSWFDDLKTMLSLTDRWIQSALKLEDFAEMESAVSFRERYLEPFPKEHTMQAFYRRRFVRRTKEVSFGDFGVVGTSRYVVVAKTDQQVFETRDVVSQAKTIRRRTKIFGTRSHLRSHTKKRNV
ncbi:MAG: hypothetical protein MZU97_04175 [Bacillus subtilis]|nr:hypothetical protein [Bacillus subtilis]